MTRLQRAEIESTAQVLAHRVDGVFESLVAVLPLVSDTVRSARPLDRAALQVLRGPVEDLVSSSDGLVDGAGIAVAPGLLADAEIWLQWWRGDSQGKIRFTSHSFNPASLNYYDYTAMNWFQVPVRTNQESLIGPYIDIGGTDLKVITASIPVAHGPTLRSVIAADLSLDFLELTFLRALGRREQHVVLATKSGKVVASNTARHVTGTLLSAEHRVDANASVSVEIPFSRLSSRPWQLLVFDQTS